MEEINKLINKLNSKLNIDDNDILKQLAYVSENNKSSYMLCIYKNKTIDRYPLSTFSNILMSIDLTLDDLIGEKNVPFNDDFFINEVLKKESYNKFEKFINSEINSFSNFYYIENSKRIIVFKNSFNFIKKEGDNFIYLITSKVLSEEDSTKLLQSQLNDILGYANVIIREKNTGEFLLKLDDTAKEMLGMNSNDEEIHPSLFSYLTTVCSKEDLEMVAKKRKKLVAGNVFDSCEFTIALDIKPVRYIKFKFTTIKNNNDEVIFSCVMIDVTIEELYRRKLLKLSTIDSLTGVYNRHKLFNTDVLKYNYLLFLDLNNLKDINDNFGHLAGDFVIKETANKASVAFENDSDIFRYAGDEFVILTSIVEEKLIKERVNSINGFFSTLSFGTKSLPLSASCGYCKISDNSSLEELIEHADEYMYQNKNKHKKGKI